MLTVARAIIMLAEAQENVRKYLPSCRQALKCQRRYADDGGAISISACADEERTHRPAWRQRLMSYLGK